MKILILNSGSSSIKYQLIDTETTPNAQAKGVVERIGMRGAILNHSRADGDKVKIAGEIVDHQAAIEYILAILLSKNHGVLQDRGEIDAVGHRVVHGGEKFTGSVLIGPEVMEGLQDCIDLAPLHNPHNIKGIVACQRLLANVPMVGFSTPHFIIRFQITPISMACPMYSINGTVFGVTVFTDPAITLYHEEPPI